MFQTSPTEMLSTSPSLDGEATKYPSSDRRESLLGLGTWSTDFAELGLPSFKPMYLFLVRIPLDVVHECLRLRLEQRKPETDPSPLSVRQVRMQTHHPSNANCKFANFNSSFILNKFINYYLQLIRECKEVLLGAVIVKQWYQQMVIPVEEDLNSGLDLECFEANVQQMLDVCTL